MKRMEIIANKTVEEDLFEALEDKGVDGFYTQIPTALGRGRRGRRRGDTIWPDENFVVVIYCDEMDAERVRAAVAEVKERFLKEGIKLFEMG